MFFDALPGWVDYQTREQAEATLARVAAGVGPEELRQAAERLRALLDPDGRPPTDAERAGRRYLTIGGQDADGMSQIQGLLDPQARATLDAVLAKRAAPDAQSRRPPTVHGEPDEPTQRGDLRSPPQRNHDALTAMGRAMLASGQLGQHNGLPTTIVCPPPCRNWSPGVVRPSPAAAPCYRWPT